MDSVDWSDEYGVKTPSGTSARSIFSSLSPSREDLANPSAHLPWPSKMTEAEYAGIAFDAVEEDKQLLDRLMAAESNLYPLSKAESEEDWIPSEVAQRPDDDGKVSVSPPESRNKFL